MIYKDCLAVVGKKKEKVKIFPLFSEVKSISVCFALPLTTGQLENQGP